MHFFLISMISFSHKFLEATNCKKTQQDVKGIAQKGTCHAFFSFSSSLKNSGQPIFRLIYLDY